jgi:Tannase and feruloyl esterase
VTHWPARGTGTTAPGRTSPPPRAHRDDTDPYLGPFEKAGGKLILWQGTGDWSIPTDSSLAYYQAVVKAMGGLSSAQQFTR